MIALEYWYCGIGIINSRIISMFLILNHEYPHTVYLKKKGKESYKRASLSLEYLISL